MQNSSKLHIGCGKKILNGWINLDIMGLPGVDVIADLDDCKAKPLPFKDNTFSEIRGEHVIEHIKDTLSMMQELHRISKPDARAIFVCPYGSSDDAFEDPTHVRPYFEGSFGYFSQPFYWLADYGYKGDWQPIRILLSVDTKANVGKSANQIMDDIKKYRNTVKRMAAELIAIKPIREAKRELQKAPIIEIVLG